VAYRFLGDYRFRVVSLARHLAAERGIYRVVGVNPDGEQSWGIYARSVLAFSAVSLLFQYALLRLQSGCRSPWASTG
jgi:K+-transporting ATPase ATPase A chain